MEDATRSTVSNSKDYTELLKSGRPVVVDFMASGSGKVRYDRPLCQGAAGEA